MSKRDKRGERMDTSAQQAPLTSNPFAALESARPREEPPEREGSIESPPRPASCGLRFDVQRTKKGGYPVFLEKRPNGKNVTVIRNISGDLDGLVTVLKRQCGAGGAVREGSIEIQGDHRDRVEAFLRANQQK